MRKLLTVLAAASLAGGGATVALAEPGPHGPNNFGLCTAHENNRGGNEASGGAVDEAEPFAALIAAAAEDEMTVAEWCAENGQRPGPDNNPGQANRR